MPRDDMNEMPGDAGQSPLARKRLPIRAPARLPNGKAKGQIVRADKAKHCLPSPSHPQEDRRGHHSSAEKANDGSPADPRPNDDAAGHSAIADLAIGSFPPRRRPIREQGHLIGAAEALDCLPSLADTIAVISAQHKRRIFGQDQRIRITNATGRLIARALGWSMERTPTERKAIDKRAAAILAGKEKHPDFAEIVAATELGAAPFEQMENEAIKEIERLAKSLPVWKAWGEAVNGFGPRALGTIVALAGDLLGYPRKGHLWKRLGLAVIDGQRQGSPGKGAAAEDWIRHGYSKRKRSLVFAHLVQPLMTKPGRYRDIYLARKAYEEARAHDGMTKMHIHRRAHRYMEKRLIADLWRAWKSAR